MFQLIWNLISYTGTYVREAETIVLYATIVFALVFFVVLIDLVYRLIRSFVRK